MDLKRIMLTEHNSVKTQIKLEMKEEMLCVLTEQSQSRIVKHCVIPFT